MVTIPSKEIDLDIDDSLITVESLEERIDALVSIMSLSKTDTLKLIEDEITYLENRIKEIYI